VSGLSKLWGEVARGTSSVISNRSLSDSRAVALKSYEAETPFFVMNKRGSAPTTWATVAR
jgi:hypothetical protein